MGYFIGLILSVLALIAVMALPALAKRRTWGRFFLAMLLSLFAVVLPTSFFLLSALLTPEAKDHCHRGWIDCFHIGKLALTPFVFWATAALYAVEVCGVANRTRTWIVQGLFVGAIISSVCLVFGFVIYANDDANFPWLVVPLYTAVWYIVRAVQVIGDPRVKSWALFTSLAASLPFWAMSIFWSYMKYFSLPEHPPQDCFVVTAASRGHRRFVGPFQEVTHRGQRRLANRQLATLWQFEELWRSWDSRSHAWFRRRYNHIGPKLARKVTSPLAADLLYVALKPIELFARALVQVSRLWPLNLQSSQSK